MLISLFDAFTVAPMLSAYMATKSEHGQGKGVLGRMLAAFDRFQTKLENLYERILVRSLNWKKSRTWFLTLIEWARGKPTAHNLNNKNEM